MDKKQLIEDLQESLGDAFESIEKIKGAKFADAVKFLHMSMHTFRLFMFLADKDVPTDVGQLVAKQYSSLVDFGLEALLDGLSEEDVKEVWKWAEQLDKRIDVAMKELNK